MKYKKILITGIATAIAGFLAVSPVCAKKNDTNPRERNLNTIVQYVVENGRHFKKPIFCKCGSKEVADVYTYEMENGDKVQYSTYETSWGTEKGLRIYHEGEIFNDYGADGFVTKSEKDWAAGIKDVEGNKVHEWTSPEKAKVHYKLLKSLESIANAIETQ